MYAKSIFSHLPRPASSSRIMQRLGSAAEVKERGNFPDFRQPQWRDASEQTQKYWLSMMQ